MDDEGGREKLCTDDRLGVNRSGDRTGSVQAEGTGAESKPRPVVAWQHHLSRIIYYRATTASSKSGQERDYRNCRQETSILPTNLDVLDFGLDCESSRSIRISFLDSLWDHTVLKDQSNPSINITSYNCLGWKITHASIDRLIKQYGACSTSQTLPILICGSGVDTAEEEGSGEEEVPGWRADFQKTGEAARASPSLIGGYTASAKGTSRGGCGLVNTQPTEFANVLNLVGRLEHKPQSNRGTPHSQLPDTFNSEVVFVSFGV
uniref:Uncharacterized protein n=1 Tax=Vespula pensylvanica TaxID=30213 RepID=A0A834UAG8_VESPE|nr:hypothetical protein H0235_008135 [Vespula pensylvanica]